MGWNGTKNDRNPRNCIGSATDIHIFDVSKTSVTSRSSNDFVNKSCLKAPLSSGLFQTDSIASPCSREREGLFDGRNERGIPHHSGLDGEGRRDEPIRKKFLGKRTTAKIESDLSKNRKHDLHTTVLLRFDFRFKMYK